MKNYTTATIEGYVTRDPVLKTTKTGKQVCVFSLAVNHSGKGGNVTQAVSYIDVETWEKMAEVCAKNVVKGKRLIVIGVLRQDRWEGTDGKQQSKVKIVASEIRMLEKPSSGQPAEAVSFAKAEA